MKKNSSSTQPTQPTQWAVVQWNDSCFQRGEVIKEEFNSNLTLTSCGLLVSETDTHISLATDYDERSKTYRFVTHILKSGIIGMVCDKFIMKEKDFGKQSTEKRGRK